MTKSEFRSSWSDCGTAIVTFREILYNNPSGFENSTGELNTRTVLNTGTYFTSKFLLYNSIKTTVSMTTSTAVRGENVEFRGSLQSRILRMSERFQNFQSSTLYMWAVQIIGRCNFLLSMNNPILIPLLSFPALSRKRKQTYQKCIIHRKLRVPTSEG